MLFVTVDIIIIIYSHIWSKLQYMHISLHL